MVQNVSMEDGSGRMAFQWPDATDEHRVMVIDDPTTLQVFLQPLRFRLLRSLDVPHWEI